MSKRFWLLFTLACCVTFLLAVLSITHWWWVEVHTGTVNEGGPYYGWWSGFGGFCTLIISAFGAMFGYYKIHLECHSPSCHRPIAHSTTDGHQLCRHCIGQPHKSLNLHFIHPDHKMTAEQRAERDAQDD